MLISTAKLVNRISSGSSMMPRPVSDSFIQPLRPSITLHTEVCATKWVRNGTTTAIRTSVRLQPVLDAR